MDIDNNKQQIENERNAYRRIQRERDVRSDKTRVIEKKTTKEKKNGPIYSAGWVISATKARPDGSAIRWHHAAGLRTSIRALAALAPVKPPSLVSQDAINNGWHALAASDAPSPPSRTATTTRPRLTHSAEG